MCLRGFKVKKKKNFHILYIIIIAPLCSLIFTKLIILKSEGNSD